MALKYAESLQKELWKLYNTESKRHLLIELAETKQIIKNISLPIEKTWDLYLLSQMRPSSGNSTLKRYQNYLLRFITWLHKQYPHVVSVGMISEDMAVEYMRIIENSGVSNRTYNAHLQALNLVFRVLGAEYDFENPFVRIVKKRENKKSHKEFTEEEVVRILKIFDDSKFYVMYKEEMQILFHFVQEQGALCL